MKYLTRIFITRDKNATMERVMRERELQYVSADESAFQ